MARGRDAADVAISTTFGALQLEKFSVITHEVTSSVMRFRELREPVIPGWSEGPDLRCAIAHREIPKFRVRCFASPRNDGKFA